MNHYIFAILLHFTLFSTLFGHYPLTVCAIFQNEAPYLKEWIEFHRLQGVEHFYLYNNHSGDAYQKVLKPYVNSGLVTLTEWPYTYKPGDGAAWRAIQMNAYDDCLSRFGADSSWIAFIDIDEFLYCPNGTPLTKFLEDYTGFGGLGVNWRLFGTSNVEKIPKGKLLIETLIRCSPYYHYRNIRFKSIVQPRYTLKAASCHAFHYVGDYYGVDAAYRKIEHPTNTAAVLLDQIRINHYWTRDEYYFTHHKIKSRHQRYTQEDETYQRKIAEEYNTTKDGAILQFVPQLRRRVLN